MKYGQEITNEKRILIIFRSWRNYYIRILKSESANLRKGAKAPRTPEKKKEIKEKEIKRRKSK